METRLPTSEGQGAVTPRDLVRNALRMRPDRIILGEVRGGEALDMLQAMNTGHEGSLTTIHANDTRDALSRLEVMVSMAGFDLPVNVIRRYIASAITVLVHLARLKGGVRARDADFGNHRPGERRLPHPGDFPLPAGGLGRAGAGERLLLRLRQRPATDRAHAELGIPLSEQLFESRPLGGTPSPSASPQEAVL